MSIDTNYMFTTARHQVKCVVSEIFVVQYSMYC